VVYLGLLNEWRGSSFYLSIHIPVLSCNVDLVIAYTIYLAKAKRSAGLVYPILSLLRSMAGRGGAKHAYLNGLSFIHAQVR